MPQRLAVERADDNQPGYMMTSPNVSGTQSLGPLGTASGPSSSKDGPVVDDFVARYAPTFDATESTHYRKSLALRLEVANDPRAEWYWQLLSTINGWTLPASLAPVLVRFTQALRAHSRCWRGTPIRRSPRDPDQLRPGRLASVPGHRSRCDTCHRSSGFRTGQSFSYSLCVRRYRWLWKSCAVASAVAFPMGTLVAVAYDSIVLGAIAAVLLGDAVILGIIAIRGGVHPTLDEASRQPCSCGPRS